MEGSEKFNDIMKHHYNRNSNKKNVKTSLFQIVQKQNRCELKRPRSPENLPSVSKYLKTQVREEVLSTPATSRDIQSTYL